HARPSPARAFGQSLHGERTFVARTTSFPTGPAHRCRGGATTAGDAHPPAGGTSQTRPGAAATGHRAPRGLAYRADPTPRWRGLADTAVGRSRRPPLGERRQPGRRRARPGHADRARRVRAAQRHGPFSSGAVDDRARLGGTWAATATSHARDRGAVLAPPWSRAGSSVP